MSTLQSKGWLWDLLLRLFGASKPGVDPVVADAAIDDDEADAGPFVVAPGGYRIRVPQSTDVNSCVGEMLPSVRAGLEIVPPLPKVVIDLLREIQDPKSTAASVAAIASSDPALAASLIRTVNAAAVGLARKISSVSEAVSYLGFGAVKSMVVRLRLDQVMVPRTQQGILDNEDLWVHSLAVSYAADCLARRVHGVDAGFAATLGLLHDIGKLAIVAQLPDAADALNQTNDNLLAHEANVLGVDHAGLGGNLGAKWKLPADLVQAIRFHHRPGEAFHDTDPVALRQAVFVVHIANQLAKYCFTHADQVEVEQVSDGAFALLGLKASLPSLLDSKMRSAIGRAVLLADANTRRSATTPRRFLRLLTGEAALRAASTPGDEPRVTIDNQAIDALLAADVPQFDASVRTPAARGSVLATDEKMAELLTLVRAHQDAGDLSAETRSIIALVTRSLLPNLMQIAATGQDSPNATIEMGQSIGDGRVKLVFRSTALATARRIGQEATGEASRRLADAELANLLNLGWFDRLCVSSDGTAMFFERAA